MDFQKQLCKTSNVKQRLTTAYNLARNGETEKSKRTLTTMLRKELKTEIIQIGKRR